jgi:Fe-S cluster assembly protein SufD
MNNLMPRTPAEDALGIKLPTRRMEEWKWTDLSRLITTPYALAKTTSAMASEIDALIKKSPFAKIAAKRVVIVNGHYDLALSHVDGLTLRNSIDTPTPDDDVARIGQALMAKGITLSLSGNVDTPVEIVHIVTKADPRSVATRLRIEVAADASATVVETFIGSGDYLVNAVTEIELGEGARLDRIKAGCDSGEATHLSHVEARLAKRAQIRDFSLTASAKLTRQNGSYSFDGDHGEAKISGAYMLAGRQHADTRLVVDHRVPHCVSRELFKCVMDGQARGIFQGKVIVQPNAQKTDGKQSSHALLLSETAEFDAKPELEIFADDVVCGHGATSGDLNHDHLFYMRSRGVPEAEARALLIAAFVSEAFDMIEHDGLREALRDYAENWLATRAA